MKKTNQVAKKSCMSMVSVKDIKSLQDIINSIVGHLGVEHTLQTISLGGHSWAGIRQSVSNWIGECGICQKITYQRPPDCQDQVEHHLYCLSPLTSLAVHTLDHYIYLFFVNFSKLIGLYPARNA